MSNTKIIEPDSHEDPKSVLGASIRRIPLLKDDGDWLASAFLEDTEFKKNFDLKHQGGEPDAYEVWVEEMLGSQATKYTTSRDATLVASFIEIFQEYYRLVLRGVITDRGGWSLKPFLDETDLTLPNSIPQCAESFLSRDDIDWDAGVALVNPDKPVREVDVVLYRRGKIHADAFVKPDFHLSQKLKQPDSFNRRESPCYWIMLQAAVQWLEPTTEACPTVPGALAQMFPMFIAATEEEKVKIALGLVAVLRRCSDGFNDKSENVYQIVAHDLLAYFRELHALVMKNPFEKEAVKAWWTVGYHVFSPAFGDLVSEEHAPYVKELLGVAVSCLGGMRVYAKNAAVAGVPPLLESGHLRTAFNCANSMGSRWEVLKPLLLAFSSLTSPAVANDLRYWGEPPKETPPQHWSAIPEWITTAMQPGTMMDIERMGDPSLLRLRTQFAKYCLSRLKTRKPPKGQEGPLKNEDFVEPRPLWRQCYVRAARELKVNPQGTGHHILYWSSSNDPDPEVREQAKVGYKELRHGLFLEEGHGPRRPLYAAFWFLRQAHFQTLRPGEIDANGARRTREKEVRRASESL